METGEYSANKLLAALPAEDAKRIVDASRIVELPLKTPLFQRESRPRNLYFLTSGVASIVFTSERGTSIELATIGAEGLVGATFLLGPQLGHAESMTQVAGRGYATPLKFVEEMFHDTPSFNKLVLEFCQHQTLQAEIIVACNRLHMAEQRFSRWLLMVQDRLHTDVIPMTQEFLSNMLGTRRTTVAEVSADLARAGAIENRRGVVHIVDRAKLENHACECYVLLRELYGSLYANAGNGMHQ